MSPLSLSSPIASIIWLHPLRLITPLLLVIIAIVLHIYLYPALKTRRHNTRIALALCKKERNSLSIEDVEFILRWSPQEVGHAWVLEDMRQSIRRRRVAAAEIKNLVCKLAQMESARNLSNTKIRRVEHHLKELPHRDLLTGAYDASRENAAPPPYYSPSIDHQISQQ